jgi:hypothetical protein
VTTSTNLYEFSIGDHGVIRLECSHEERYARVVQIHEDGSASWALSPRGRVRIWPSGSSSMGSLTLIKHVPAAQLQYISRDHKPELTPRQAEIKAWLATRSTT